MRLRHAVGGLLETMPDTVLMFVHSYNGFRRLMPGSYAPMSLTYTGGLSRSYVRTYAPARRYGFDGFSPYTRPDVIEVAEAIPFASLTQYDVPTLYALKGEIVRRGVKAVTGFDMPVFPKRRFQHGALPEDAMRSRLGNDEASNRRAFYSLYA